MRYSKLRHRGEWRKHLRETLTTEEKAYVDAAYNPLTELGRIEVWPKGWCHKCDLYPFLTYYRFTRKGKYHASIEIHVGDMMKHLMEYNSRLR